MLFAIGLLIVIVYVSFRLAPVEREEHAHIHGAGQIGLLAAVALFGVDYFTSYFYATGEMMSALHPYGMQKYAFIAVLVIALTNAVFGLLYMYSLGIFNEGGGSYTASMRYLMPGLSLIVAVVLLQDYIFTIVVSSLSGVDQLLSVVNAYNTGWYVHVAIGVVLVTVTWYLTIRGRGESARVVFTMLGHFCLPDNCHGNWPVPRERQECSCCAVYRIGGYPELLAGHVSYVDRLHERSGGAERPGGHVEWHPVRHHTRMSAL